jgi:hypothetical protein
MVNWEISKTVEPQNAKAFNLNQSGDMVRAYAYSSHFPNFTFKDFQVDSQYSVCGPKIGFAIDFLGCNIYLC